MNIHCPSVGLYMIEQKSKFNNYKKKLKNYPKHNIKQWVSCVLLINSIIHLQNYHKLWHSCFKSCQKVFMLSYRLHWRRAVRNHQSGLTMTHHRGHNHEQSFLPEDATQSMSTKLYFQQKLTNIWNLNPNADYVPEMGKNILITDINCHLLCQVIIQ